MSEAAQQLTPQAPAQTIPEGTTTPAPQESKPDPRLAQLARRERMIREQQRDIKEREMAIRIKEQMEYIPKSELDKYVPKSKLQENTFQTLNELGIPYDKVTREALENSDPILQRIAAAEQRAAAAEMRAEELEKQWTNNTTQSVDQAKAQMKAEARKMVNSDERYEVIRHEGMSDIIVDVMEMHFNETGKLDLEYEQIADVLEKRLTDRALQTARLKKVQSLLTPTQEAAQQTGSTTPAKYKRDDGMKATIVSRDSSPRPTLNNQIPNTTKPLTPRERAILAGGGKL
jgi:hypothetical protein